MKSKTKIEKQLQRKKDPKVIETIIAAKKEENWKEVAGILSSSRKNKININLDKINKNAKQGEKILIPGKVLSMGDIDKKINVIALGFSEKAREKLLKAKCEVSIILHEIKKNPGAKGIRILINKEK